MKRFKIDNAPSFGGYALVLLLVNLSGNFAFSSGGRQEIILLLTLAAVSIRFALFRRTQARAAFAILTAYVLIFAFQAASLNFFAPVTISGFLVRLILAAVVVITVRSFRLALVRVIVWLTVLSFVFHIPNLLARTLGINFYEIFRPLADFLGAESQGVNERMNVLLHTFQIGNDTVRNSGVFWEPGAFSGYLILALLLLATLRDDLPIKFLKRWRVILVLGVLSTLSTTGYIVLPFALFTFRLMAISHQREIAMKMGWVALFFVAIMVVGFYAWNLNFIGEKIVSLYLRAANQEAGWQLSRFGAMKFDWEYIQRNPLFGWGKNNATQYSLHPNLERFALGNGLSGYLRQFGVVGLGTFIVALWVGLGRIGTGIAVRIWILAVILLTLNGEYFLDYPLFLGLHFLGFEHVATRRRQRNSSNQGHFDFGPPVEEKGIKSSTSEAQS